MAHQTLPGSSLLAGESISMLTMSTMVLSAPTAVSILASRLLSISLCAVCAAMHASMERSKTIARVCRAAAKRPQNRSNLDIAYIAAETQHLVCFTQHGPAAHRDLCHVVQVLRLNEMNALKLPGEHKCGVLMYVSTTIYMFSHSHWCNILLRVPWSAGLTIPHPKHTPVHYSCRVSVASCWLLCRF